MVGKGLTVKNFSNLTMQEVAPEVTCISTNRQVPFSSEQLALAELPSLEKYFRTSEVEQEQVARLLTEVAVVAATVGLVSLLTAIACTCTKKNISHVASNRKCYLGSSHIQSEQAHIRSTSK